MSNFGEGFTGFKTLIDAVSEDLGGAHTREAGAFIAGEMLRRTMQARLGLDYYTRISWTAATDRDFDISVEALERQFARREHSGVLALAPFKGAEIALLTDPVRNVAKAVLRGALYEIAVLLTSDLTQYDSRAMKNVTKFSPFVTDDGVRIATGSDSTYLIGAGNKSITCQSPATTFKSARKLVKDYFKVELADVA